MASLTSGDGEGFWEAFLGTIPDEMDSATQKVLEEILGHTRGLLEAADVAVASVSHLTDRKEIAEAFSDIDPMSRWLAFLLLDDRRDYAWVKAAATYEAGIGPIMAVQDDE
jgi:hypothetical protein